MSKSLDGRKAIVTGGSRGIGAGIALELAKRGADVLITYTSNKTKALEVANQIEALGTQALIVEANGTEKDAPSKIVKTAVDAWGHIDIIINNAGLGPDVYLADLTHEIWGETMACNVRFPTFLVKESLPYLGVLI